LEHGFILETTVRYANIGLEAGQENALKESAAGTTQVRNFDP
jgi:hypothetical protein